MKKVLFVIFILFVVTVTVEVLFFSAPEPKYDNQFSKYAKTNLNVRRYPKLGAEVLKVISPNEKVIVYDSIVNGFILILNRDSTGYGWASKNYLQNKKLTNSQLQKIKKRQKEIIAENKKRQKEIIAENKKRKEKKKKNKKPSIYLSDASYYAHKRVLELLKSPSTADFGLWDEQAFRWNDGTYYGYKIKGYVDSQNSFGAMLRTYYTVNVGKNAKGEVATSTPILK